jgi:hypothetical protein
MTENPVPEHRNRSTVNSSCQVKAGIHCGERAPIVSGGACRSLVEGPRWSCSTLGRSPSLLHSIPQFGRPCQGPDLTH